jgi:CRISPR/Cas system CMR-associated protein Cmr1 (group 7 of RAMP superfamily)
VLIHVLVTSKRNAFGPVNETATRRALSRWKTAWDRHAITIDTEFEKHGFMIHAGFELWLLAHTFSGTVLKIREGFGVSFELKSSCPTDDMSYVNSLVSRIGQLTLESRNSRL